MSNDLLNQILALTLTATPDNVGEVYEKAIDISAMVSDPFSHHRAEQYVSQIRGLARKADIGWKLFHESPSLSRTLTDEEIIQILTLISTLHTFCYGAERLDEASSVTGPDSTPVRFYINSLYHYIAALYLLQKGEDPIGGMVYKTLSPLGLTDLLDPIKATLKEPMEEGISFGETIRKIRNDFLVHGVFSPEDTAAIVSQTRLRDLTQVLKLADLIWELFNRTFVLKLRLISLLTALDINVEELTNRYLEAIQSREGA
jgi:hypothetical protein